MARRGRKRKTGRRHPGGKLVQKVSPREVAAGMPHRRWLGDKGVDQLAENELGRLLLRELISGADALAGDYYGARWRGYVVTLSGPRNWPRGSGSGFECDGCLGHLGVEEHCFCALRRRRWLEAQ